MRQQLCQSRQAERGFTLVELAIVMIIIGLLIGGILKGQELIANSRVTSTVAQVKGVDAAITTFRDQYNAMPGDLANTARLPACTAGMCAQAGDGDNLIENGGVDPGAAVGNATESAAAFVHLAAAGVMGGVQPSAPAAAVATGTTNPAANIGGTLSLAYGNGTAATTGAILGPVPNGHYIVNLINPTTSAATGVVQAKTANNVDSKLDDGLPNTGSVRAGGAAACTTGAVNTSNYNSAVEASNCSIFVRIQQ
jgi:prepilin-type N-terminal cleavage/methylation domain-containing protein